MAGLGAALLDAAALAPAPHAVLAALHSALAAPLPAAAAAAVAVAAAAVAAAAAAAVAVAVAAAAAVDRCPCCYLLCHLHYYALRGTRRGPSARVRCCVCVYCVFVGALCT